MVHGCLSLRELSILTWSILSSLRDLPVSSPGMEISTVSCAGMSDGELYTVLIFVLVLIIVWWPELIGKRGDKSECPESQGLT